MSTCCSAVKLPQELLKNSARATVEAQQARGFECFHAM